MSLLGDLEQEAIKSVLGNVGSKTNTTKQKATSKKSSVSSTLNNDLVDMATKKIKDFTPDSIDKIVDDISANFKK